eukprot:m.722973 g.722973  ORF g.722973 m.722973 type:complete len:818 (+) comp23019_c3_seq64:499-2952(+)
MDPNVETMISQLVKEVQGQVTYDQGCTDIIFKNKVRVPLPLVNDSYDPNLSFIVHGNAAHAVATVLKDVGETSQHKKVLALVQVSGAGKTKLTIDLCLRESLWPVYIPLKGVPGSPRKFAAIEALMDSLGNINDVEHTEYVEARTADNRRVELVTMFIVAHVWAARQLFDHLGAENETDEVQMKLKRLHFVYCQIGCADKFSRIAKVWFQNHTDQKSVSEMDDDYSTVVDSWRKHVNFKTCVVYDEVTAVRGILRGYFLHQHDDSKQGRDGKVYLDTRTRELKQENPDEGDPFQAPTDLFYALRRGMNRLLELQLPQIMSDTHFSIAEEIFKNEGSATRELIEYIADLPPVSESDIREWFLKVFQHEFDGVGEFGDLGQFCGRSRFFYDSYVKTLLNSLKDTDDTSTEITDWCVESGITAAKQWLLKFIKKKALQKGNLGDAIRTIFVEAWRHDGCFMADTKQMHDLVNEGLIFAKSDNTGDFKEEIMLWDSIRDVFRKNHELVREHIMKSAFNSGEKTIGTAIETVLGWLLFCHHGMRFQDVFPQTHPQASTWITSGVVNVTQVVDSPDEENFADILANHDDTLIFPEQKCGPDIVFTLSCKDKDDNEVPVRVYVQVKNRGTTVDFYNALYTVEPCLFYKNRRPDSVSNIRSHKTFRVQSSIKHAFSQNASLDKRHVRLIVSPRVSDNLIKWMNTESVNTSLEMHNKPVLVAKTQDLMENCAILKQYVANKTGIGRLAKPRATTAALCLWAFPRVSTFDDDGPRTAHLPQKHSRQRKGGSSAKLSVSRDSAKRLLRHKESRNTKCDMSPVESPKMN